jgi:beta-glucuronidase
MDFRFPDRNIPRLQDGFNRKGLNADDGKKRKAFHFFEQTYRNKTVGMAE